MAEHAREGAPQPRVRVDIVRQPVGADHRVLEAQHPLHIGLVHRPIDRARRLQPLDRLLLADAPIARRSRRARGRPAPGALFDQVTSTFSARSACAALQHGRGGDVGIGVEPDLLARDRRGDQRQGLGGAAEIVAGRSSCGARSPPAPRRRGRRRSSLRGCRARRRPRCAYASCRARRPGAAAAASASISAGGALIGRRVGEPARQADRAGVERLLQPLAHPRQLGLLGRPVERAHRADAQGRMADEASGVERRRRARRARRDSRRSARSDSRRRRRSDRAAAAARRRAAAAPG